MSTAVCGHSSVPLASRMPTFFRMRSRPRPSFCAISVSLGASVYSWGSLRGFSTTTFLSYRLRPERHQIIRPKAVLTKAVSVLVFGINGHIFSVHHFPRVRAKCCRLFAHVTPFPPTPEQDRRLIDRLGTFHSCHTIQSRAPSFHLWATPSGMSNRTCSQREAC